jgi:cytochrome c553
LGFIKFWCTIIHQLSSDKNMMRYLTILSTILLCNMSFAKVPEKIAICSSCHGIDGQASQTLYPNLAGQSAKYLCKQLIDYKNKQRSSEIMQVYANLLTNEDIEEIAVYYSKLPIKISKKDTKSTPQSSLKTTETLFKVGDYARRIPACSACHAINGRGNDPAKYPSLAGQNPDYTIQQLYAFKKQLRQNDPKQIMQNISQRLSKKDIQLLAEYIHQLD